MAVVTPKDSHTCALFVPITAVFSLDLVAAAYQHIRFLQCVHTAGLRFRASTVDEFRRYIQLWLPFLKVAPKRTVLIPALNTEWLWHCRRLAPASYARACADILGAIHALDCPESAFLAADVMV